MNSRVYIVRVWFEPSLGGEVWGATVTHVQTKARLAFSSPALLSVFLSERNSEISDQPSLQPSEKTAQPRAEGV